MAYYTVASKLQGSYCRCLHATVMSVTGVNNLDGKAANELGIRAEDMTRGAWDYVFLGKPYSAECVVPESKLQVLRNEFLSVAAASSQRGSCWQVLLPAGPARVGQGPHSQPPHVLPVQPRGYFPARAVSACIPVLQLTPCLQVAQGRARQRTFACRWRENVQVEGQLHHHFRRCQALFR